MRTVFRHIILKTIERYTRKLIRTHKPIIVGVTGSVGKTSTKLAIAHLLEGDYKVNVHEGNYNTDFGLPLSIFRLDPPKKSSDIVAWLKILKTIRRTVKEDYPYDVLVLELGADKPGDIQKFMDYLEPDIGIVTAVAKVHYEAFSSIEHILDEKWSLAEGSKKVFYNYDDKRLRNRAEGDMTGYGLTSESSARALLDKFEPSKGWSGKFGYQDWEEKLVFPVVGRQSVYALTVATAVANELGVSRERCIEAIESWQQPSGRMQLLTGKKDATIIDDSYNASPYSTVAALDALYRLPGRKVAILGSMNELGEYEQEGHEMVGQQCGDLDMLITIGEAANQYLAPAAVESGVDISRVHKCNSPYEAGQLMSEAIEDNDSILVKGSQGGVYAEESIKPLLADTDDSAKLVRQSDAWQKQKEKEFDA